MLKHGTTVACSNGRRNPRSQSNQLANEGAEAPGGSAELGQRPAKGKPLVGSQARRLMGASIGWAKARRWRLICKGVCGDVLADTFEVQGVVWLQNGLEALGGALGADESKDSMHCSRAQQVCERMAVI